MRKFQYLMMVLMIAGVFMVTSSCDSDDESVRDLDPPTITFANGRDAFRPEHNEVRSAGTDHMHVRFKVEDESGILQILVDIHHGFDGHSHARTSADFEFLNVKDIYSSTATETFLRIPEGAKSFNVDGSLTDIYWGGPTSRVNGNVLAGPYDFIISATDIHGNQTSFAENTNYIATFYIERPYAPQVTVTNLEDGELHGEEGEALEVIGSISKSAHNMASDIKFVWIRLAEEDDHEGHSHRTSGEDLWERKWGQSSYREGAGGKYSGPDLPNTSSLDLSLVLSGDNALILPDEHGHFDLIIWVEDVNGNVTRKKYEVHVD
ncbi:MAG: DUF4625 domain-containing protein [Cyclobacteriaceae bacterium]|nr:DUF4625 domain-containing protein [Cyclobacteriaceae bacterium]